MLSGTNGFLHEASFYGSDKEFLAVVGSFVKDGVDSGEKVLVALPDRLSDLLRAQIPEAREATYVPGEERSSRPATSIRTLLETFQAHKSQSTERLRVVASIFDACHANWEPWARYEAAVNELFAGYLVWGLCPYDTRTVPEEVVEDVKRTHPVIHTPDGRRIPSRKFEPAPVFLSTRPPPKPDPLEATIPYLELVDPTAGQAREAVVEASGRSEISSDTTADLVQGVSEIVTNAHVHGLPPVVLRVWTTPERIVATVYDSGNGPADPLAGLVPARPVGEGGGLGLWITHQVCSEVIHSKSQTGFTVRLTADEGTGGCNCKG